MAWETALSILSATLYTVNNKGCLPFQDGPVVKEKITNADKNHLRRLHKLNTPPTLAKISKIDNLDSHYPVVEIVSNT